MNSQNSLPPSPEAWRDALIAECAAIGLACQEDDPTATLHALIHWHVQAEKDLDPTPMDAIVAELSGKVLGDFRQPHKKSTLGSVEPPPMNTAGFARECRDIAQAFKTEYSQRKARGGITYFDFDRHPYVGRAGALLLKAAKLADQLEGVAGASSQPQPAEIRVPVVERGEAPIGKVHLARPGGEAIVDWLGPVADGASLYLRPIPPSETPASQATESGPEGWHAPGLGEVHNHDHMSMVYCTRADGDGELPDDALASRVCFALSGVRGEGASPVEQNAASRSILPVARKTRYPTARKAASTSLRLTTQQREFLQAVADSEKPSDEFPQGFPLYLARVMVFDFNSEGERKRWFKNLETRRLITLKNTFFARLTDLGRQALAAAKPVDTTQAPES